MEKHGTTQQRAGVRKITVKTGTKRQWVLSWPSTADRIAPWYHIDRACRITTVITPVIYTSLEI